MELGIADGTYSAMFYGITGFFVALMIAGMLLTVVTAFQFIGGRGNRELLAAHAIYWYAMAAIYSAIWFLVYVTK
jgi:heme/copper-type cytochrome/quinol oxidase subunit 3